jgi:purine-cytosine permease-like protein
VLLLFTLFGCAGPKFNVHTQSVGHGAVVAGNRLSYVLLSASGALGWSACACDFFVYFPPKTNRWVIFSATTIGLACGKSIIEFMGIGLGSGLATNPSWKAAFARSKGALLVEAFKPLGGFGSFCSVLASLGIVANNVPG